MDIKIPETYLYKTTVGKSHLHIPASLIENLLHLTKSLVPIAIPLREGHIERDIASRLQSLSIEGRSHRKRQERTKPQRK